MPEVTTLPEGLLSKVRFYSNIYIKHIDLNNFFAWIF